MVSRAAIGHGLGIGAVALMAGGAYMASRSLEESGGRIRLPLDTWDIHTAVIGVGLMGTGVRIGMHAAGGLPVGLAAIAGVAALGATTAAAYLGDRHATRADERQREEASRPRFPAENWIGDEEIGGVLEQHGARRTETAPESARELIRMFDRDGDDRLTVGREDQTRFVFDRGREHLWWAWHAVQTVRDADAAGDNDGAADAAELEAQVRRVSGGPLHEGVIGASWLPLAASYEEQVSATYRNWSDENTSRALPQLSADSTRPTSLDVEATGIAAGEVMTPDEVAQRLVEHFNVQIRDGDPAHTLRIADETDFTRLDFETPTGAPIAVTAGRVRATEFATAADAASSAADGHASREELRALAATFDTDHDGVLRSGELAALADEYGAVRLEFSGADRLVPGGRAIAAERVTDIEHFELAGHPGPYFS